MTKSAGLYTCRFRYPWGLLDQRLWNPHGKWGPPVVALYKNLEFVWFGEEQLYRSIKYYNSSHLLTISVSLKHSVSPHHHKHSKNATTNTLYCKLDVLKSRTTHIANRWVKPCAVHHITQFHKILKHDTSINIVNFKMKVGAQTKDEPKQVQYWDPAKVMQ